MNDELLRMYYDYSEVQLFRYYEPELGVFIAESPKVIERAINAGYMPLSLLIVEEQLSAEGRLLLDKLNNIPCFYTTYEEYKKKTDLNITNGMLSVMRRKAMPSITELVQGKRRIAVLDNVTNPTNVGAIIRGAAALGMEACIITTNSSDPLYRRAARVSMGNVFQLPWTYGNPSTYIEELAGCGFKTVALALREDSYSVSDPIIKAEERLALVLGNEGWGLPDTTIKSCDYTVMIPMQEGVDSLNVSQASTIAFWELRTKDLFLCDDIDDIQGGIQNVN